MKNNLSMLLSMLSLRVGEDMGHFMLFLSSELLWEMVVFKKDINNPKYGLILTKCYQYLGPKDRKLKFNNVHLPIFLP